MAPQSLSREHRQPAGPWVKDGHGATADMCGDQMALVEPAETCARVWGGGEGAKAAKR